MPPGLLSWTVTAGCGKTETVRQRAFALKRLGMTNQLLGEIKKHNSAQCHVQISHFNPRELLQFAMRKCWVSIAIETQISNLTVLTCFDHLQEGTADSPTQRPVEREQLYPATIDAKVAQSRLFAFGHRTYQGARPVG